MSTNNDMPAFPRTGNYDQSSEYDSTPQGGMLLRDWFAGQALAGSLADPQVVADDKEKLAWFCYRMADAMMAAREKP